MNPAFFWRDTLQTSAPIAIITGLSVLFTYWIMSVVYPDRPEYVATMTVLTATFWGVYSVLGRTDVRREARQAGQAGAVALSGGGYFCRG